MSLASLPNELLGAICLFCDIQDIRCLRLTCRPIQKVADEHLVPELVVFMNRDSLETCKNIAAHPVFSKAARSLWIQADRPVQKTFEDWNELRIRSTTPAWPHSAFNSHREVEPPILSEDQLKYHHEQANLLASDAIDIFQDGSLSATLQDIFEGCSSIQAVDVTLWHNIRWSTTRYNKAFQRGLLRPVGDLENSCYSGAAAMAKLVLAASEVGFQPRYLRLGSISHYIFRLEAIIAQVRDFFKRVEELEWRFSLPYLDEDHYDQNCVEQDAIVDPEELNAIMDDFNEDKSFLSLVEGSSRLTKLHLELPGNEDEGCRVLLPSVVGSVVWRELSHLHLSRFQTTSEELSGFILRHGVTLKNVFLAEVFLRKGSWPDCFASIAGKLVSIQTFDVRGRFGQPVGDEEDSGYEYFYTFEDLNKPRGNRYSKEISRYVIAGGLECPPQPAQQARSDEEWSDGDYQNDNDDDDDDDDDV